ncbi:MAG: ribonuclease P protein component 1 [Thermoplasmata archaeon]|nr:ribonuclease P protein component 1 [Thermoplasmata archaeon]
MTSRWTLSRGELIGLPVEVVASTDPGLVRVAGRVVDETKNTIVVRLGDGRESVVPKNVARFRFGRGGEAQEIDGRVIAFRPEDRPKRIRIKNLRDDSNASNEEEGREEAEGPGPGR